jgi:hypothetical protein
MERKSPAMKPEMFSVIRLETPSQLEEAKPGRKRRLKMPPIPQEVFDGMTALELEHYHFFVEAYQQDYPGMKPTDLICLHQAALEYINTLRVQAKQLKTGEVISMARQHPGVQLRAWLDAMSVTRKARTSAKKDTEESDQAKELKAALKALSA